MSSEKTGKRLKFLEENFHQIAKLYDMNVNFVEQYVNIVKKLEKLQKQVESFEHKLKKLEGENGYKCKKIK